MGHKRNRDPELGADGQSTKRHRHDQASGSRQYEAGVDATYGQRAVFPSIGQSTVPVDEDLEFEDEREALAYLQSVRQEASGIPHLLVAPKAGPQLPPRASSSDLYYDDGEPSNDASYSSGVGDARGYYQDGAYTAAPDEEGDADVGTDGGLHEDAAGRAYYASLAERFVFLRRQLEHDPPEDVMAALPPTHNPAVGIKSSTHRIWAFRLENTDPLPAQIAAMDKDVALAILRVLLQGKFLRHSEELTERTSRWIWSLLARLPDRGEMDYAEIGCVRDLGKRAVLMLTSVASIELLREQAELDEGGEAEPDEAVAIKEEDDRSEPMDEESSSEGGAETASEETESAPAEMEERPADSADESMEEGEVPEPSVPQEGDAGMEAIRRRLLASLDGAGTAATETRADHAGGEATPDKARAEMNLRATLNMILTIAGEFYGQRDLLQFRSPFTAGL